MVTPQEDREALEALEGAIRVCLGYVEAQERAGEAAKVARHRTNLETWARFAAGRRHFFDQGRPEPEHFEYCVHALEKLLVTALPLAQHFKLGDDLWPFYRAAERLGGHRPTCLFRIFTLKPPPGQ